METPQQASGAPSFETFGVHRRTNISLQSRLVLLLGGITFLTAAAAFCLNQPRVSQLSTWRWDLLGAALAVAAAGLCAKTVLLLRRVRCSLRMLRQKIVSLSEGDEPSEMFAPTPASELCDLHESVADLGRKLDQWRSESHASQQHAAQRTRTVDRLLEFSQTIAGAGRVDQIFPTLCHFILSELALSGVAILEHTPDQVPNIALRLCRPDDLVRGSTSEFDAALCPCLRQAQPRLFRANDAPVRCTIDNQLSLPQSHEAFCIPFGTGKGPQYVIHMLLPQGQIWTEQLRHLAQTYVNTAQSAMTSLQLLADAEKQSMTDMLTGLFNRRSLDQLLSREFALADRHHQPLSLVMIDLDHFKEINDAHGHAAGDHLLRAFADCVRITLRKTDLAFRWGGDEFLIALPQTPLSQAQQVVQKLRQAFSSVDFSSAIAHLHSQPTLSIGLAERSASMNLLTLPTLLSAADQALYDAKTVSRNCVRTYQPPKAA